MRQSLASRGREPGRRVREDIDDRVQIEDIPDEGLLLHLRRAPAWIDVGVPLIGDIDAWMLLFKINRDVTADVEGTATLQLQCGRCLKEFEQRVQMHFRQMFLPLKQEELEQETELDADDLGVTFYRTPEIALQDLIREELILDVPLQPLCDEDCPGLCPTCGADLSAGACSCAPATRDPRFSALAGLL